MTTKLHGAWQKIKNNNEFYDHGTWQKKNIQIRIFSDISFGNQRNVVVEDLSDHTYEGYRVLHVEYCDNQAQALAFVKEYMRRH